MKRLVAAFAAVFLCSAPVHAQTLKDFLDQARKRWDAPTEPFRVIGNVYYVGTRGLAAYLVVGPAGHMLIDTVMPGAGARIAESITKLGFKLYDVKYLVNTHAHLDHAGNFAELKQASGAQMIAGARDKALLESGVYPGRADVVELQFPAVKVDRTVVDGDVVQLGFNSLVAHSTPGHSPGCTTWTLEVSEKGVDHNVIFFCSGTVALNRLVGAEVTYPGIVEDYRRTLETAGSIKGDVFLAPHPEMFDMDAKRAAMKPDAPNPFVRPGEFQAYVAKLKSAFDADFARQQTGKR